MTNSSDSAPARADLILDVNLILHALQLAVQEALLRHKQAGNPVAVWHDGRVEWVAPGDIPTPESAPRADDE